MRDDGWVGVPTAAQQLGLVQRTVYRLIDVGELPGYKFGRVIRIKQEDVDRFVEAHRIEPGSLGHLYPSTKEPGGDEQDEEDEG
jgi:excisionase family DNA binding protein